MKVYGIDFTSTPKRSKPITCLECRLEGDRLEACELAWKTTTDEDYLAEPDAMADTEPAH